MAVIRVEFWKVFHKANINGVLVNTIHDSIVCDVEDSEVQKVVDLFHNVFSRAATLFEERFGVPFNLTLLCEVGVGSNMKELEIILPSEGYLS